MQPHVKAFYDPATYTVAYVAYDPATRDAVVIDPVLDLDLGTWRTTHRSSNEIVDFVRDQSLHVRWILDTHAHADHLTGMEYLKDIFGAPTAIGREITAVQQLFAGVYNTPDAITPDGSEWDRLLSDGEHLSAGSLQVKALHTPGHTPACLSFQIGDSAFTGDALFMPDFGTGRCDFPKGSAETLYDSITQKLYTLPDSTRVFVGHDYQPGGRDVRWETTIGKSKAQNVQLRSTTPREDFVSFRQSRDQALEAPRLILQSLQVNIRAGKLPEPEANGRAYLKMPINFLGQ